MSSALVVFVSKYGQAEKIARYIAELAHERGLGTTMLDLARTHGVDPAGYDATIIVAPVYFGRHPRVIENFLRVRADVLSKLPTAFVSVSNSAGSAAPEAWANADRIARVFVADTGVCARLVTTAGGALAYPRYGFLLRMMMKLIAKRSGDSLDTTRVHEHTDWTAIGKDFAPFFDSLERDVLARSTSTSPRIEQSGVHPKVTSQSPSAVRVN
ncbi:MAG TPA: flavodoxin domain-containing protein [Labilithrix sp.]|nr:flavodoxin domain-containing protein [Labilithrix sp.]